MSIFNRWSKIYYLESYFFKLESLITFHSIQNNRKKISINNDGKEVLKHHRKTSYFSYF